MKNNVLKLAVSAIIGVQLWFIYIILSYPTFGINVKNINDQWSIAYFDSRNISEKLDLKKEDVIVSINGEDPGSYFSVRKWRTIDQAKNIVVSRNESILSISPNGVENTTHSDVQALVGEFLCFFLVIVLYKKMPNSRSAKYLAFVFLTIGATFMSLAASIRGDTIGKHMVVTFVMLLPVIFLNFLIVFLKEKGAINLSIKYLKYLYGVVIASFIMLFVIYSNFKAVHLIHHYYSFIIYLFFIFGIILNFTLLISVFLKYRKENSFASAIIKTIWISLIISFSPLIFLCFIPIILNGHALINPLYLGWFVMFFPLSFAYLIFSRQIYDIDVILRRSLFTGFISILPSAVFVGINKIAAPNLSLDLMLIEFILFVVILTLILYSLEYTTTKLEFILFPRKHQLQLALKNIAKNLGSISNFRQLKDIFLVDIVNSIQVYGGAIVFKYKDSIEVISEGRIDEEEVLRLIEVEMDQIPDAEEYSIFEISRHEEFTSYLIMTQKMTNTRLGLEDKQWLNLILSYLSVSLENIHLVRKLTKQLQQWAALIPDEQAANEFVWFRKLMFELQERERVRIATDLHDTTMQDLFFLKDRLLTILEKYILRDEDKAHLQSLTDYIDVINSNLRQSCFELHPYLLKEIGLIPSIEKLIRFERAVTPFELQFFAVQSSNIENTDLETKRHLFRIVQELVNNAKKHSHASKVQIVMHAINGNILFEYEDDGVGYEAGASTNLPEIGSSGVGLAQMKNRVLFLNGKYELESGAGKGYKFKATFPLKEGQTA